MCQETHRQRALYHPYRTARILGELDIDLTGDISHWTCVCERLLDVHADDKSTMAAIVPYVSGSRFMGQLHC